MSDAATHLENVNRALGENNRTRALSQFAWFLQSDGDKDGFVPQLRGIFQQMATFGQEVSGTAFFIARLAGKKSPQLAALVQEMDPPDNSFHRSYTKYVSGSWRPEGNTRSKYEQLLAPREPE